MIIRKPYAFLIKNFKLINFVIALILIYITTITNKLYVFFKDYVKEGWYSNFGDLSKNLFPIGIKIAIIGVIILICIIIYLLKFKDKPINFYLVIIGMLLVTTAVYLVAYFDIITMEQAVIDPKKARLTRDILFLTNIPQYFIIFFTIIRATGFDIKKFNFGEDLVDLNIELEDNEEFELEVGVDKDKLKRKIKGRIRKIKYVLVENNALVLFFSLIILIIIGFNALSGLNKEKRNFNEKEVMFLNGFSISATESFVTSKSYGNLEIEKNSTFVIIRLSVKNQSTISKQFSLKSIDLVNNNDWYDVKYNNYKSMSDLGMEYKTKNIKPDEEVSFIVLYDVPKNSSFSNLKLRMTQMFSGKSFDILLRPKNIENLKESINVNLKENLLLGKTILNDSELTINNYDVKKDFTNTYNECVTKEYCSDFVELINVDSKSVDRSILKIEGIFKKDKNLNNLVKNLSDLIDKYGTIYYEFNSKKYKLNIMENKTPLNNSDDSAYFEVSNELKEASKIELVLRIRDYEYIYKLK